MKFPVDKLPKEQKTWNLSEDSSPRTEKTTVNVDVDEDQIEATVKERSKTINEKSISEKTTGGW
jgi:hypothetical protein